MKISVITPLYALAGVPLAQLRWARVLASRGHEVRLLFGRADGFQSLDEPSNLHVEDLRCPNVRSSLFPIMRHLSAYKPDLVFSAEDHLNVIVLLAAIATRSRAKVAGSSRVTPFDTYSRVPFSKKWFLKQAMRGVMWRADLLTCVSEEMVNQYKLVFGGSSHVCVYNVVGDKLSLEKSEEALNDDWIYPDRPHRLVVAAGRLAPWKGFADLIKAFKIVSSNRNAKLLILGDGPLRESLNKLIEDLELSKSIRLAGYVKNPLKYFKHSDVFALTSYVEGLPNVLVEAMSCGCTPVATDCETGPREVLQNGKYGFLVPVGDVSAIASSIERAIDSPIAPEILREAVNPFKEGQVVDRYTRLLNVEL